MNNASYSIRDAQIEDAEAILAFWSEAGATPSHSDNVDAIRHVISDDAASVLLAVSGERIIGSVIEGFDGWRGSIYRLAVHPEFRRKGIARALVAEAEKRLAARGVKRIGALVEFDHGDAVGFWKASGYKPDERLKRYCRDV